MRELHLFAGAGGGILGGILLGHVPVCAVELEEYPRNILLQRQRDGVLPWFPVWDDVCTFDGRPWAGGADVICGGFPCQDISSAGKGAGINGERSGLWSEFARIIGEVRPRFVFVENSPMLTSRGLGRVLGDLASLGFDAEWCVLGACDAGAPHRRERIWILAHTEGKRHWQGGEPGNFSKQNAGSWPSLQAESCRPSLLPNVANPGGIRHGHEEGEIRTGRDSTRCCGELANAYGFNEQGVESRIIDPENRGESGERPARPCCDGLGWWETEPALGRVANGVAHRVDRLKAIGNGQVPAVAALAWGTLMGRFNAR